MSTDTGCIYVSYHCYSTAQADGAACLDMASHRAEGKRTQPAPYVGSQCFCLETNDVTSAHISWKRANHMITPELEVYIIILPQGE